MSENSDSELQTDSLAKGISFLAAANVLQRGVGFLRNLAFCYFLTHTDLGLWALASSFLVLAPPLAVLGVPGSFGRFVETYRQRGQLRSFLKRTAVVAAVGVSVLMCGLLCMPADSAELIFGTQVSFGSVFVLSLALISVIVFNGLLELLNGLRQPSAVSSMQLLNSLTFSLVSIPVLCFIPTWQAIVITYTCGTIVGIIPGVIRLKRRCMSAFAGRNVIHSQQLLLRIAPFAATVWASDLLTNLFDVVDRYMLLHYASNDVTHNQALVGQFHTARILPVLFLSLATMLAGIILPYWSSDWEAGHRDKVRESLLSTLKFAGFLFWTASIAVVLASPLLFELLLRDRYQLSQATLPLAMVHCILAALSLLLGSFLRCIEANRMTVLILSLALLLNIAGNICVVPHFGIAGAMSATLAATSLVVLLSLYVARRVGPIFDHGLLITLVLPFSLLISPVLSLCLLVVTVFLAGRSDLIINASQRSALDQAFVPLISKMGLHISTLWPHANLGVSQRCV